MMLNIEEYKSFKYEDEDNDSETKVNMDIKYPNEYSREMIECLEEGKSCSYGICDECILITR